ncbi:MAG: phosphopentomutase [Syntrophomonadaceae bacterium]|jgi:phosphopentomutase
MSKKAIVIVLDGVGIGEMPDSVCYGDEGSNTLENTAAQLGGLHLPSLERLGLGNIASIEGVAPFPESKAAWGKMQEKSAGKDSTTGHWEMMGLVQKRPFPTYPHGFPQDLIKKFEEAIGKKTLGNIVASGTAIIEQLGKEHLATGFPIVYTSADSVFQIAAHEEIIPPEQLYEMCRIARQMLTGEHGVGRVIARPFRGRPGAFVRTANRHDFSLEPERNLLDFIIEAGQEVVGVGKIKDLFAGRGLSRSYATSSNQEGMEILLKLSGEKTNGLLMANLLDFDQQYGHRNDTIGFAAALQEFDRFLPGIMSSMMPDDLLFITADHGCDPTTPSTDHSREYVPLLVFSPSKELGVELGTRESFADLGQTIAEFLAVKTRGLCGRSFYSLLKGD